MLIFPALILATLVPLSILVSPKLTPSLFLPGIVMGLTAGLLEEIGWTGFALPRMRARHGILVASLALGFVHALWHGLADFLGNSNEFGEHWLPYFAGFFLFVMALRVLMGWVYANTESVLLGQLMHASSTGFLGVLVPIGIGGSPWTSFYTVYAVAIWTVMAAATAYALTASLRDRFDAWFFASVALIGGEVVVLVVRRFKCPLTTIAERYTDDRSPTFDIYLPRWVAKHNIRIFTSIFVLGVLANLLVRL